MTIEYNPNEFEDESITAKQMADLERLREHDRFLDAESSFEYGSQLKNPESLSYDISPELKKNIQFEYD